jgi:outer membrane protease
MESGLDSVASAEPIEQAAYAPARASSPFAANFASFRGSSIEFGTRYWYGNGSLAKNLYDDPRASTNMNSRLTFSGLTGGTFEGFGRWDGATGILVKGTVGLGDLRKGELQDEDFPPAISPYSSTLSAQHGGKIGYANADLGLTVMSSPQSRFSLFAGYGFLKEKVSAYGCTQVATDPFVCVPSIPNNVLAITESTRWHFVRLGATGDYNVTDRVKFTAEVAWVPYALMSGTDAHWLRIGTAPFSFSGPIPEDGNGSGVQLEGLLSYQVWNGFNLGVGGRFWSLQTKGSANLESVIVALPFTPAAQPLDFKTTRYGGFVQGSYKFGPL